MKHLSVINMQQIRKMGKSFFIALYVIKHLLTWFFYGRILQAGLCDGSQSEIGLFVSFVCVTPRGQSIVLRLLFWSLSSTTWTMLFLLLLRHFVWDCPSQNYLAWLLGMGEFSGVLSLSLSQQNKQLGIDIFSDFWKKKHKYHIKDN